MADFPYFLISITPFFISPNSNDTGINSNEVPYFFWINLISSLQILSSILGVYLDFYGLEIICSFSLCYL